MQVSRSLSHEEFLNLRIDAFEKPLGKKSFDSLLEKLDVDNISQEDRDLFLSIMADKRVTQTEFYKLDYEQMSKFKQLLGRSDLEGNALGETVLIFESVKMSPFLATADISDDEDYNKAVFNVLKSLNLSQDESLNLTQDESISFINEFGGGIDNEERREFENRLSNTHYDSGVRYKTYMGEDMFEHTNNRILELKKGLAKSDDETAKKDYANFINIYTSIQREYKSIKSQNDVPLEQYTRNTKPNPLYNEEVIALYNDVVQKHDEKDKEEFESLLKKLEVNNLSESEKELFRGILEDKEFSNIEMDSLSYEQMKKISQLLGSKVDDNGERIFGFPASYSSKTNALLSTTNASDDEDFNRALFDTVKNMDDIDLINAFLMPLLNYVEYRMEKIGTALELDMFDIIDEMISQNEQNYSLVDVEMAKERHLELIGLYENFKEYYDDVRKGKKA